MNHKRKLHHTDPTNQPVSKRARPAVADDHIIAALRRQLASAATEQACLLRVLAASQRETRLLQMRLALVLAGRVLGPPNTSIVGWA
jgi:hypothetical protein